ncbi:MAG: hypothetical protein ACR2M7_04010 [Bdellovibrionales bacterium]
MSQIWKPLGASQAKAHTNLAQTDFLVPIPSIYLLELPESHDHAEGVSIDGRLVYLGADKQYYVRIENTFFIPASTATSAAGEFIYLTPVEILNK